jgi:tRNA(Ile)-lysidine synthase
LLATAPGRLRATLRHRGQTWVEDPSNADLRSTRVRLRAELDGAVLSARPEGLARAKAEMAAAAELAVRAAVYPEGFAVLSPGRIGAGALAMLLRSIGAQRYGAAPRSAATLAACLRPATLAGVRVLPAGRLGPGWLLVREEAAMQPPVVLADGAVWDGRFRATGRPDGAFTLGALGADAVRFRHTSPWPAAVLAGLPALRRNNMLSAVPHLAYVQFDSGLEQVSVHHAGAPVCGAPFMAI